MSIYAKLANAMFPNITMTPADYEEQYPQRQLAEGARVTRIAPSPTGYLHLGTFFTSMVNRMTADSTGGLFFFRLEDTDKKREVEGGIENIIGGLKAFGIEIDEEYGKTLVKGAEGELSTANSKVKVYVLPTNEELVIARDTRDIVISLNK